MNIPFVLMSLTPTAPAGYWLTLNRTDTPTKMAVLKHFGKQHMTAYEAAMDVYPERTLLINIRGGFCWLTSSMTIHERITRNLVSTRDSINFPVVIEKPTGSIVVDKPDYWAENRLLDAYTNENPKPSTSTGEMGQ